MYFYLKQPKSEKETLIIIQYYVKSEKAIFKYSTGEKINPENWDFENRLPKSKKGLGGAKFKKITSSIMFYDTFLERLIDNCKINNVPITRKFLKTEFDKHFKKVIIDENKGFEYLTDFIDDFVLKAPELVNRSTKRKYTPTKITHYKKVNNRIKEFETQRRSRIKISEFDLSIYDELIKYLTDVKKYSVNYTGNLIKNIKKLLKVSEVEYDYNVHKDYKRSEFSVIKEESISIALNEDEVDILFNHDFSENERLQNCRDLAIIGLWTGLRVSDFLNLPKINVDDRFITVQPKKTKNSSGIKVVIPLHHQIKEVINQRGMPKMISDVKFNEYIKEVCQEAGFNDLVKGSLMVKDEKTGIYRKKVDVYPKYKLVSSHTCRRSFATNLYKMNFPTLSIMKITGHTSEKSFLAYIKVTPTEHAEKLLNHWNEYYNSKNVISQ